MDSERETSPEPISAPHGVECPRCHWHVVHRAPPRGELEEVLDLVWIYPFRCQICMFRFRAWGWSFRHAARAHDRREYTRLEARLPASASFHRSRSTGELTETSVMGATLATDLRLPEGALIQLEIQLSDNQTIAVDGALVRSLRENSLGLQFVWMRVPERARLEAFVLGALAATDGDAAGEVETRRREAPESESPTPS